MPTDSKTSGKGTSRELLKELDRTKKQLKTPLDQALTQLESVNGSAGSLDSLPVLLEQLIAATTQFADAAPELAVISKQLKSMNKRLKTTSDFAVGLGPVLVDIEQTLKQIQANTAQLLVCEQKPASCN